MRPVGTAKQLEIRRREAIALFKVGMSISEIARQLGAAKSAVSGWVKAWKEHGDKGLDPKPGTGSKSPIRGEKAERLMEILDAGALAYGFPTPLWTCKRVCDVIEREFGLTYTPSGAWRLLDRLGYSPQKPTKRSRKRDEEAIKTFKEQTWPEAAKKGGRASYVRLFG